MTHHGTTRKIVEKLVEGLGAETTTSVNLEKNKSVSLHGYDAVVIGGSIHVGQIQPGIKRFCEVNRDYLLTKKLGLFICFMNQEMGEVEFENAFPEELRKHAAAKGLFGGEFLLEKMNMVERFMVKMVAKETKTRSQINYSAIEEFVNSFK